MKPNRLAQLALAALTMGPLGAFAPAAMADDAAPGPREVPAKSLPVPTDVSPGMQKFIAAPLNPNWNKLWKTGEEWRAAADKMDAGIVPTIPAMAERLHVKIEPATMDGVKVFVVTPDEIPPENRNRLLIHIHADAMFYSPARRERPKQSRWPGWSTSKWSRSTTACRPRPTFLQPSMTC